MKMIILMMLMMMLLSCLVNASDIYDEVSASAAPNGVGTAWINVDNLNDSDYSTTGVDTPNDGSNSYFYENYTYPAGTVTSVKWQVKDANAMTNLTIDLNVCNTTGYLGLAVVNERAGVGCSTSWFCVDKLGNPHTLRLVNTGGISGCNPYEDGVFWNIADPPPPPDSFVFLGAYAAIGIVLIIAMTYFKGGRKK